MKKRDPNKVIDEFQATLGESAITWGEIGHRIGWEADLAKALSVDAFLRAAVAWETFRSDWHVAAINNDSSAFRKELLRRYQASMDDKWHGMSKWVSVDLPKHPSLDVVSSLIDARGFNVTFESSEKWVSRCATELVSPWREKAMSLGLPDHRLVDSITALRDCIAHRSRGSIERLDLALKKLSLVPDKPLRRGTNRVQPSGIGAYLFAIAGPAGARRVQVFHARLDGIAESLRAT
jgi:hypothetical protein